MLGINGDDLRPAALRLSHDQLTGTDQRLLVGKANTFLRANGRKGGFQAQHPHNGGDDAVHAFQRRGGNEAFFPPEHPGGQIGNGLPQLGCPRFRSHHGQLRAELPALLGQALDAGTGSQCTHANLRVFSDNVQALPPDGTGRAQNTDAIYHMLTPPKVESEAALPQEVQ